MAPRARRSAGAEVSASAEQLSDTTLDYEAEAFAEIDSTYAEIAESLETTEKSVKALVHRARCALSEKLGAAFEGGRG